MPRTLPRQPRLRVRRRLMRVVAALFPVKIHRRVTGVVRRRSLLVVLALKTLLAGPSFDQRAVHTEMLVRQPIVRARLLEHLGEGLRGDLALQQSVAILA